MNDPSDETQIIRSTIWYHDGSIVLQAETTQFCVHASVLSQHSVVFRDMLSVPASAATSDAVDGKPLVHVSDRASEIKHLLLALYDPSCVLAFFSPLIYVNWSLRCLS
jgi:hypothetical protein